MELLLHLERREPYVDTVKIGHDVQDEQNGTSRQLSFATTVDSRLG